MENITYLYRAETDYATLNWCSDIRIVFYKFKVVKHTTKGVWIDLEDTFQKGKKFVLLSGTKRFAHPTKEEALNSLKHRKHRQIKILTSQLSRANHTLYVIENGLDISKCKERNTSYALKDYYE